MAGTLYLVATPIGNLKDITLRALEVLRAVDVIACEDTRHSAILLQHYDISKRLIAYHKHNEQTSAQGVIALLKSGKDVALISDAGMPVISDPGNILVNKVIAEGLPYTIIPGASAGLSALVLSGFSAERFAFFGFLSEKNKVRAQQIADIGSFDGTAILYSSCHNVNEDLLDLHTGLGDRQVCVCSEITKIHESAQICALADARIDEPKGEYVLVLKAREKTSLALTDDDIVTRVDGYIAQGMRKTDSIKMVASDAGLAKSDVYNLYEKSKRE